MADLSCMENGDEIRKEMRRRRFEWIFNMSPEEFSEYRRMCNGVF